jgi:hypothetical protein
MPNISGLVNAISTDVISKLAGLQTPVSLTDGTILVGRVHVMENSMANRIVMVPVRSNFAPRDMPSKSNVKGNPIPELLAQWATRSLLTEKLMFEVHVWGQAVPPDPNTGGDFDATQLLYQTFVQSCHDLMVGAFELSQLVWTDQKSSSASLLKSGSEAVFGLTVYTPILDYVSYEYVSNPPGPLTANTSVYFEPPQMPTQVSSASNGAEVTAGTLNVMSTTGFPTTGELIVTTTAGFQPVFYTGVTSTSFTGCTSTGNGTVSTGNAVAQGEGP